MEISNLRKDIIDIKNLLKLPKKVSNPNDVGLMDLILDQITASSNINNSVNTINNSVKELKQYVIQSNEQLNKISTNTDFLEIINTAITNIVNCLRPEAGRVYLHDIELTTDAINGKATDIYNRLNGEVLSSLRSINNSLISIDVRLQEKLTPMLTALNQIVTNTSK